MTSIKIQGVSNIRDIYRLLKESKTKHWPIRQIGPGVYEVTLRESDPMLSYILLRYSTST